MIKGIIFDLGATLIELQGDLAELERQGAENVGRWYIKKKRIKLDAPALAEALLTCRQAGLEAANKTLQEFEMNEGITQALRQIKAPKRAEAIASQAAKAFFQAEEDACVPVADAAATLKALCAQNFKMGLLSNATDDALVQRLVNRNDLRPWLSPVFSSAGLGWKKPKAEPFLFIAKRWKLNPAEIVVVGDSLGADIQGAQNAGMKSALVTRISNPNNEAGRHIQPDATIAALSELPAVIRGLYD